MANEEKGAIKMSGYLEKKGKMCFQKVVSSWKSHWFVLEGRLLLYYRSKDEYDALSPCKGSINLGPPCNVKPSSLFGGSCIFQIETRSSTVALKAKNKTELEKWLQAILAALNQNSPVPNGMMHFRYSSENLFPDTADSKDQKASKFTRQNTLPGRLSHCPDDTPKRIVGDDGDNDATRRSESGGKFRNFRRKKHRSSHDITFTSGDDTHVETSKRQTYPSSRSLTSSRCSLIVDNDQYCTVDGAGGDDAKLKDEAPDYIYERVSGDEGVLVENDNYIQRELHIYDKPSYNSILVENDQYCGKTPTQQDPSRQSNAYDKPLYNSVSVENDQYCTPQITINETGTVSYHEYNLPTNNPENIYSLPLKPPDHGTDHNDNSVDADKPVNPYSVCQLYAKCQPDDAEYIYAVPDEIQPDLPPRHVAHNIARILARFKKPGGHDDGSGATHKLKKKGSFMRRMFRKKRDKDKKKCEDISTDEDEYVAIDENVMTKLERNRNIDSRYLEELKNILMIKKDELREIIKSDASTCESPRKDIDGAVSIAAQTKLKPVLPSKQKDQSDLKTFAFPKLKKTKSDVEHSGKLKTIDEILDDLNAVENVQKLGKVKKLIEIFDKTKTSEIADEDVVLRTKSHGNLPIEESRRYSDDLNVLLNELIKVTSAPILTPGVTSSLGVSSTEDAELFCLVTNRKRRLSDPDYDVPRPHTNLRITKKEVVDDDDKLTATRFFGPVLNINDGDSDQPTGSITPDSLELDRFSFNNEEHALLSYASHRYTDPLPGSVHANATSQPSNTQPDHTEKNFATDVKEESFMDSLEVSTIL